MSTCSFPETHAHTFVVPSIATWFYVPVWVSYLLLEFVLNRKRPKVASSVIVIMPIKWGVVV